MPEFIRVRVKDSGTEQTIPKPDVVDEDAYEVLDKESVDHNGDPLPGLVAGQEPEPTGYEAATVADLKAEITRRNADRDEADQVSPQGNKPDLIAALEADDNKES